MHDMIARTTGAEGTSLTAFAITRLVKEVDQPNFTRKGEVRSLLRLRPQCNPAMPGRPATSSVGIAAQSWLRPW